MDVIDDTPEGFDWRMEDWEPVPGFPDYYAHPSGIVASKKKGRWGILKLNYTENQSRYGHRRKRSKVYKKVQLCVRGVPFDLYLAEIILTTFGRPRPPGCYVKYLNKNPKDCSLRNLEWAYQCDERKRKWADEAAIKRARKLQRVMEGAVEYAG